MTETTTTVIPDYIKQPTKTGLEGIQNWLGSSGNTVYGSKPGESLFTDMNGMQKDAIGNVKWLADQDLGAMFGANKAAGLWDQYGAASPEMIQTWGSMDASSPLGGFMNYMSPYMAGVVDPQIREIEKAKLRNQNQIGAQAAMSGAFGDARHGIMEGENFQKANQQISDVVGQGYQSAFDRAMSARQSDLGRLLQAAQANQSAAQNATERKATAAQGITSLGDNLFNKINDVNDSLYNAGSKTYQFEEAKRKAMQDYQTAVNNKDYEGWVKLLSAVQGAPMSTQSKTSSDTGWLSILGAGLGALL